MSEYAEAAKAHTSVHAKIISDRAALRLNNRSCSAVWTSANVEERSASMTEDKM